MEILNQIIDIIISGFINEEIFQGIGSIKKRIGNNIIFDSKIEGIQGIGLVLVDNDISNVSFVLKEAIPFKKLNEFFSKYHLGYNQYDGISVLSFELSDKIWLVAKKEGYISSNEISNFSFSEFELKK